LDTSIHQAGILSPNAMVIAPNLSVRGQEHAFWGADHDRFTLSNRKSQAD
jgi:hypothetical protein